MPRGSKQRAWKANSDSTIVTRCQYVYLCPIKANINHRANFFSYISEGNEELQSNNLKLTENQFERETSRRSGLELLRIVAMVAIIGHHFFVYSPWREAVDSIGNDFLVNLLGCFGRSGVNVFVMVGAWFLTEKPFNSQRMIRLYLACFFYTVCGTAIVLWAWPLADQTENVKAMLRALLPLSGSPLWFVSDYLALLFLMPFLNLLVRQLTYEKYKFLVKILLGIYVGIPLAENVMPSINVSQWFILYNDFIWFVVLYLLVAFVKLHGREQFERVLPPPIFAPGVPVARRGVQCHIGVLPQRRWVPCKKNFKYLTLSFHQPELAVLSFDGSQCFPVVSAT